MLILDKLLGIATVGSVVANATSLQRLLSGLTSILALTVIGTILGSVLLVGCFGALYMALVYFGLNIYAAAVMVSLLMFAAMAVVFLIVIVRLRQLRELTRNNMRTPYPGFSQVSKIFDAFIEGILETRKNGRHV